MNEIKLVSNPVIDYKDQLKEINESFKAKLEAVSNMVVSEDAKKEAKELKKTVTDDLKSFEEKRIQLKKDILKPYDEFEEEYKKQIKEPFEKAAKALGVQIDSIEDEMKRLKTESVKEFFNENNKLDWLTFDKLGLKIGMSETESALKKQVTAFIEKVNNEVAVIMTQDNKERVLVAYQGSFDLASSISLVNEQIAREQAIKDYVAPIVEVAPQKEVIIYDNETGEVEQVQKAVDTNIMTSKFKASGTKAQLIALREYMKGQGISYEQLIQQTSTS